MRYLEIPAKEPGLLFWVAVLFLARQTPFNSPRPLLAGQAQLDNWELGKAQPRSLARAKSHKPQCLHFSTPPPPGLRVVCREGKGRRWRLQVISSRTSHPLASSGGQGGVRFES